jgi:hypothetical protein
MSATVVLALFLTFLVGGMVLALAMGYRSIEDSRAQQVQRRRAEMASAAVAVAPPGFFAWADGRKPLGPTLTFDDALLAQIENHVRAEQAVVRQFVHFPSVDSLYLNSGSSLRAH